MTAMDILVLAMIPVSALSIAAWVLYINRPQHSDTSDK